ncbi:myb-related transcription factor, partner of profilin-like [Anguilla rostrata]|uniref:myb-related transcription factor, partner of profilin-like n=1 Tax=Anguilla rostrata TaxID=7938 RepID=UPI0030CCB38F
MEAPASGAAGQRARLRKPKFTPDQIRVLMECVVEHRAVLYGEEMGPVSVRKRVWQEVTQAVNRVSHTQRSKSEVQKRWQDERRRIRHRAHDLWRALAETGVPMGHLTPLEEAVLSTFDEAAGKDPLEAGSGAGAVSRVGAGVGLGAAPPPQAALPQQPLLEDLRASQQPSPAPSQLTSIPVVCLQDIKLEPVETVSPAGGGSGPQDWKFEWTVEEASVASPQANSAPTAPKAPQPTPPQSPPETAALRASPANRTGACVTWPRGRRLGPWRQRQRRRRAPDVPGCAGLTACLRRVASGTAGLRRELRALSDSVLTLRGELRALAGAVSAVAGVLQGRHGHQSTERHPAGDSGQAAVDSSTPP